ncbi:hypothetical protein OE88DRAFT_1809097 [Heliocybe sulcata]|uniref:Uncharacterized protein n=1 Tax=Heliocybe sulcata TaxID=5364 RepID=A0A5C3MZ73_9AGAM|nr:hypothetical protein OE88DRAFT_1809097 [Heliocybe sulcata]
MTAMHFRKRSSQPSTTTTTKSSVPHEKGDLYGDIETLIAQYAATLSLIPDGDATQLMDESQELQRQIISQVEKLSGQVTPTFDVDIRQKQLVLIESRMDSAMNEALREHLTAAELQRMRHEITTFFRAQSTRVITVHKEAADRAIQQPGGGSNPKKIEQRKMRTCWLLTMGT